MSGFDAKRFVGLEEWMAKELECGICLKVLNKAVVLECGHSYCKRCIDSSIEWRISRSCPSAVPTDIECGHCKHRSAVILDGQHECLFPANIVVNSFVGKLRIKCRFADRGCKAVVETALLATHLPQCPHSRCLACGLYFPDRYYHNCVQELREELEKLQKKCQELSDKMADMVPKCESEPKPRHSPSE